MNFADWIALGLIIFSADMCSQIHDTLPKERLLRLLFGMFKMLP